MATNLTLKTEVEINEAEGRATFSIWLNSEAEAYTLRVEPLDDEDRETYEAEYAVRDGYSETTYYPFFADALSEAWNAYIETQAQHFNESQSDE